MGGGCKKTPQLILPHKLVSAVLLQLDDARTAAHLGVMKTLRKIQQRYYWLGQRKDVEEWCRQCKVCASRKSPFTHPKAPMQTYTSTNPMDRVVMDILGPLPVTPRGNRYILTIADYFTEWTEAYPMQDMEAPTVANIFYNFVCRFGAPVYLNTDQGRNFESKLIYEVCALLGIEKTRTSPYHPQSNGMVERFNKTLLDMLSSTAANENDWDLVLPSFMLAYWTSVHRTTKHTPFQLMFGREAKLPVDVISHSKSPLHIPIQGQQTRSNSLVLAGPIPAKQKMPFSIHYYYY